jgi:hypothetical protein
MYSEGSKSVRDLKLLGLKSLGRIFFGLLRREDGQSIRVALLLHEGNSYMTDGMLASSFLGLQEPIQVRLEIYDNCFKVAILKDESLASNDVSQNFYESLETVNGGGEDDDTMFEEVDSNKAI